MRSTGQITQAAAPPELATPLALMLLGLFATILLPGIAHGLWVPDEPRVAGICAEMVFSGDYTVPRLNGTPFLEKPPLYFATAALFGTVLDPRSDTSYRLASLLFAALTMLLTFRMVLRWSGRSAAFAATGILATCWLYFDISRRIAVDTGLVFAVALAMFAYLRLADTRGRIDSVLLGVAVGLAFLFKGLVGPAIVAVAIATDIARRRDIRIAWRLRPQVVIPLFALILLPWVIQLYRVGGWPFLRELLFVNNLGRFAGTAEAATLGHQHGPLYYFMRFPRDLLPWTPLFVPALLCALRAFRRNPYLPWFVGPFVLMSLAGTKRGVYLAPLYPAIAAMLAEWLVLEARRRWEDALFYATWAWAAAFCLLPFAGIALGRPGLGLALGVACLLACGVWLRVSPPSARLSAVSLVFVMGVGFAGTATLYFEIRQSSKDYAAVAREALAVAGTREITLLDPDETFEGALPMVAGRRFPAVELPEQVAEEGLYLWGGGDAPDILERLRQHADVRILLERELRSRPVILAEVEPRPR